MGVSIYYLYSIRDVRKCRKKHIVVCVLLYVMPRNHGYLIHTHPVYRVVVALFPALCYAVSLSNSNVS